MSDTHQKHHYNKVAKNHGLSGLSSIKDQAIREAELNYIFFCLDQYGPDKKSLLDLGCGNGHTLKKIREKYDAIKLTGLEYHQEMFTLAIDQKINDCHLIQGDMSECHEFNNDYDYILSERSFVNILNLKKRPKVCETIFHALRPGGLYIMVESFTETWINLNQARAEFQLSEIPISAHNKYLNEDTIKILTKKGFKELKHSFGRHYLSTHFYITRVWHPAIRTSGSPMDNGHFSKFFTEALPPNIGRYSPIQFRLFQKPY